MRLNFVIEYVILLISLIPHALSSELEELTENFFNNLKVHVEDKNAEYISDNVLRPINNSIAFMDKQVDNFVNTIRHRDRIDDRRQRRQVVQVNNEKEYDIYLFDDVKPLWRIPVPRAKDLVLFQHQLKSATILYAAALQNDTLLILKQVGNQFKPIHERTILNGVRLGVLTKKHLGTFIIVAEQTGKEIEFEKKTPIYLFSFEEKLNKIHNLHLDYASDVAIWSFKGEIFMAITQQYTTTQNTRICATHSIIYKWLGRHFDIVQDIKTSCAVKVTPFTIGKFQFLAIANSDDSNNNDVVYSEIFIYDIHSELFLSYQKIQTIGVTDIKFFAFRSGKMQENFIIVANSNITAENNVKSMVYKYVDGYFLPFQSFELIAPTHWLSTTGNRGEFLLIVACKYEGTKFYQYNGWKFMETSVQFTNKIFSPGIEAMNAYNYQNKQVIIIANSNYFNEEEPNVFEVEFKLENQVNKHYDNMLNWCQTSRNEMKIKQRSKHRRSTKVNSLRSIEADRSKDANTENDLVYLELQLENQESQINQLKNIVNNNKSTESKVVFDDNVTIRNLVVNDEIIFNDLIAETLNGFDVVEFLSGVVLINGREEATLPRLHLESANIQHFSGLNMINNHSASDLLHKNMNKAAINELIVRGNLIVPAITVRGTVNQSPFNSATILLKESDQVFDQDLNVNQLKVNNAHARSLNKLNLQNLQATSKNTKVDEVDNLKVKHLTIVGYMNDIDLPVVHQYALRTNGNQEITGEYLFESLEFNNFDANQLSGFTIPDDLVQITDGKYFIQQDLQFTNDLNANKVTIRNNLNDITVEEDLTLNVLLKNSPQMQFINGPITIKEVELLKPMNLQAKINSESIQKLNPLTKIDTPLELVGDYIIKGNGTIENLLSTKDLATNDFQFSIQKLTEQGIKLSEIKVPVHLKFSQQLNMYEIYADRINGINTNNLVINNRTETQYIKGWKRFKGDLAITGNTNLHTANSVNLNELDNNILKLQGNQNASGKYEFKTILTGPVVCDNILLNSTTSMEAMISKNQEQEIENAFIDTLLADVILAKNIHIEDQFNGINFVQMLEDTLFKDVDAQVTGSQVFDNLTIQYLTSRKSINMNRIPTLIERREATTGAETYIELPDGIQIQNIKFNNLINNLTAAGFHENWLDGNPEQIISGDQIFDRVEITGQLLIDSNKINNLDLWQLNENTIKIDEDFDFDVVTFNESVTSLREILLRGHIENLDLNSIVADNGEERWLDSLTFKETVTALHPIDVQGTINQFNFTSLCEYAYPHPEEVPKNLVINGEAIIMKSPMIKMLNGKDLRQLTSSIWYDHIETDLNTILQASHITFNDDLNVDGQVCETNLQILNDNYFSKTRNQTIISSIYLQEGAELKKELFAPFATVPFVNDVKLAEFVRTALLQDWDQTFEDILFIEKTKIDNLTGDFKVNGNDLNVDVMRYDKENMVTGKAVIRNLEAGILNSDKNIMVQNVDLKYWTANSVLKTGSNKLDERITFKNYTIFEKGIGLTGLLNNNKFTDNNILLKSKPQMISGTKVFITDPEFMTYFKNIKLRGMINNIQFADLTERQALTTTDNIFTGEMNFHTNLVARNVNFDGLFQNVNVSEMLHNLTTAEFVENYIDHYNTLKNSAIAVKTSLNNQASYLQHFRIMQTFGSLVDLLPIRNDDTLHLATLRYINYSFIITFFKWSEPPSIFNVDSSMKDISFQEEKITNWAALEYNFGSYWFIEVEHPENDGYQRMGKVLKASNQSPYEIVSYIPSNGTKFAIPLFLPNAQKTCVLLVPLYENFMYIQCIEEQGMELQQRIPVTNVDEVEIVHAEDILQIIAIQRPDGYIASHSITVWQYDKNTDLFNEVQTINTIAPISISATNFNRNQYLAIASGHLQSTQYDGQVYIKKYDEQKHKYVDWQVFETKDPMQVELAILPSNELLLYVLRNSQTERLKVYNYLGISKFKEVGTISPLQNCNSILPFSDMALKEHFIFAKCNGKFDVIQTIFRS